jgi:pimeloyl-ACP methyl ester carboxylesterase
MTTRSARIVFAMAICAVCANTGSTSFAAGNAQAGGPEDRSYEQFAGNYRLPNGALIGVDQFTGDDGKPSLLYSDYRSGVVRRLFSNDAGFAMGPGFAVSSPVELALRFIKDDHNQIISVGLQEPGAREVIATRVPLESHDMSFTSGDATLAGTLLVPPGKGPHPAVVLLHGSGRLTRWSFGPYPHFFTSLGLAVLVFDKRSSGSSTGTYLPRDTYYPETFLRDAVAAVGVLQARGDIDPRRVGLWGTSEGGMLATQVAAQVKTVAWVINSSGFMMPLWQQVLYNIEAELRADGFSPADVADAVRFQHLALEVMKSGDGWDQFVEAQAAARLTKWWPAYFGSSTGYSSLESIRWQWDHVYSFDPLRALRSVACPVLGVFGGLDTSTPGRAAAANMRRVLADGGNKNVTIRLFERANHPLMDARTGGNAEIPNLKRTVPGLFDTLGSWVRMQVRRSVGNV